MKQMPVAGGQCSNRSQPVIDADGFDAHVVINDRGIKQKFYGNF